LTPSHENYWRAIILFGRNVASYKFALAKSLYDLRSSDSDLITLEQLAPVFAKHICEHLKIVDKQATASSSKFLDICRSYNRGEISESDLVHAAERLGFVNVIDAFHIVHKGEINQRFFLDERKHYKGIRLTDEFFELSERKSFYDLNLETEARWRLVETAWSLGVSKHVVQVDYLAESQQLATNDIDMRRVDITSCREALNGYQKGKCFYCFKRISLLSGSDELCDVDHFFPHMLKFCADGKPVDGVANLVLSCKDCNRGEGGKFDRIPDMSLLERLHTRNEYLITSHHPLRETLLLQTGLKRQDRQKFLQEAFDCATLAAPSAKWIPTAQGNAAF